MKAKWVGSSVEFTTDDGDYVASFGSLTAAKNFAQVYDVEVPEKPSTEFPHHPGALVLINDSYYAVRGEDGLWYHVIGTTVDLDNDTIDSVVEGGYYGNLSPKVSGTLNPED